MKVLIKRAAALFIAAAMAVTAFAGCGKDSGSKSANNSSANSMFGILRQAQELEKKTFETTMEIDADGTMVELTISGASDGNATEVDIKASASGMTFEFADSLVFTDDILYINAGSIMEQLSPFLSAYITDADDEISYMIQTLQDDLGWIYLEAEGLFSSSNYDDIYDILDESYADVIEKDGSGYKISLADKEGLEAFLDATVTMLKDNKNTFVNMYMDAFTKIDVESILNDFADELVDKMAELAGQEVTDEEKEALKQEILADADFSELEVSESEVGAMIDQVVAELEGTEVTEDIGGTVNVKVSKDGDSYVTAMDMDVEDDGEQAGASIKSTVTSDSSVSVEIPSDAKSIADVIVDLYAASMGM